MKREEIRQDAEGIVRTACNLQRNVGLSDANAAVEAKLIALVRATLEEAARAVCPAYCAAGEKVYQILGTNRWWHVSFSRERSEIPCDASPVHDLIAAMDKEASHE